MLSGSFLTMALLKLLGYLSLPWIVVCIPLIINVVLYILAGTFVFFMKKN
ncbi:MAG: hypothetical protein ACRDCW_02965 [Sarcina sp.]